jgi:hypothetical protein
LKLTVSPRLTLMRVAKPWIVGLPSRSTFHSDGGLPGRLFSHAILLSTGLHGSAAAAGRTEAIETLAARSTSADETTTAFPPSA